MSAEPSASAPAPTPTRLPRTRAALERGIELGWHGAAQVSVRLVGGGGDDIAVGRTLTGRPMTTGALAPWFCAAKPLLVLALARLVDGGVLRWDDPVARYVPRLGVAGKHDVTIRHVLTHAIGFRRDPVEVFGLDWDLAVRTIARTRIAPGWTPGAQRAYLPFTPWYVIGELLATVTALPLRTLLRQEVIGPLGLRESHVGVTSAEYVALRDRLAPVASRLSARGAEPAAPSELPVGGPDVCCTTGPVSARGPASDLANLYARVAFADGPPLGLTEATWAEVVRRPDTVEFDRRYGVPIVLGLGFVFEGRSHGEAARVYGPDCSDDTFGHGGIGSVYAYADPRAGIAVAVFFDVTNQHLLNRARIDLVSSSVYRDVDAA
jgi:CubicO group peptidase (beta-lactamase class C family)